MVEGRSKGHCVNPSFHDLANWHDQDPYLFKCRSCQIFTYMHIFAVSRQQSVYIYMSDFMWNDREYIIYHQKFIYQNPIICILQFFLTFS